MWKGAPSQRSRKCSFCGTSSFMEEVMRILFWGERGTYNYLLNPYKYEVKDFWKQARREIEEGKSKEDRKQLLSFLPYSVSYISFVSFPTSSFFAYLVSEVDPSLWSHVGSELRRGFVSDGSCVYNKSASVGAIISVACIGDRSEPIILSTIVIIW